MISQPAAADYVLVPQITQVRTICHVYAWRSPGFDPRIVRLPSGAPVATDSRCNPVSRVEYVARADGDILRYRSRRWAATLALASDGISLVSTRKARLR